MSVPDPTAGEREPSPSTLWPHGPIVGHPKHDYYVCGSCHQPLAPGPCPAKVPTQPDPPTFDSLLSDPTQQLDSEGVVIASIPAPTAGERADHPGTDPGNGKTQCATCGKWVWLVTHSCKGVRVYPTSPPAVTASTGTSEDVEALARLLAAAYHVGGSPSGVDHRVAAAVLASDWLAAREAAARAEERERIAQAQRCGGCKGQGSHRRHCPRHPNYHPWIPLADRAESIGDSIGEPGLANQAWALAGAIREQMPNHPYRPVRHREAR